MVAKAFIQYGWRARLWCLVAYWRLWPVLLKLRYSGFGWLREQVDLRGETSLQTAAERAVQRNSELFLAMHEAVRLAARLHFIKADCLPKSIVLAAMLRARGYQAKVAIGVAKAAQGLASHAWVEVAVDGQWWMVGEPETVAVEFSRL